MEIVNIIILEATDMLCNYNTEKLLGLKGAMVKNVRQLPDKMEILIELPKEPHVCPCCGHKTSYVHDYREVLFLPRYSRMTSRLAAYIISNLSDVRSFTSAAREVNLSISTVIRPAKIKCKI
jgi:transposase